MMSDGVQRYWKEANARGLSMRAAATLAGVSASTLCRALRGTYAGDFERVEAACERALDGFTAPGVIETSVVTGCRAVCAAAYAVREISMIWGPTQSGKTTALRQCCRENEQYKMFRFPASAGLGALAAEIAGAYGVASPGAGFRENRRRLMEAAQNTLLIADEVHEAFVAYGHNGAVKAIEFLREVHDRTGCGLVLCGTDALPRNFHGGRFAPVLRQTLERGLVRKAFGGRPSWRDISRAAKHYGISEELNEGEVKQWQKRMKGMSFGAVCRLLERAAHAAGKRKREMSWQRVSEALAVLDQFAAIEG